MSKRALIVFAAAMLIAVMALVAIPTLQLRADHRARAKAAQVEQVTNAQGEARGLRLLHQFDCTYGIALKQLLATAAKNNLVLRHQSLQLARVQRQAGDDASADATVRVAAKQLQTSQRYARLGTALQPLGTKEPCPPR